MRDIILLDGNNLSYSPRGSLSHAIAHVERSIDVYTRKIPQGTFTLVVVVYVTSE